MPATDKDVAAMAKRLTKAQRRILIATCDWADQKRGFRIGGKQYRSAKRLSVLGLIYFEDVASSHPDRSDFYLRPRPIGFAFRQHLSQSNPEEE